VPPPPLRFGMLTMQHPPWERLVERWQSYERLGFDGIWVCDHFTAAKDDAPLFEAWTALAALARRTTRVRLGAAVTCASFRHPALLAKMAVTLDHIAGGRLEIGLGAGWWEREHDRWGIPFGTPAERVERFAESVAVLDRLLRSDGATYHGRLFSLNDAPSRPGPVQRPRPPFVLAAQNRRMMAIVAAHAETWLASFGFGPAAIAERGTLLDELALAHGRAPDGIRRAFLWAPWVDAFDPWSTVAAFEEFVDRYRSAGITDFIFDEPRPAQWSTLERVAVEVLPRLRQPRAPCGDRAR
jgi:alkanesulfonate monooxygenase SsuD/methylene tetrahydromethanopterin reductase-like flavin-dependent oxidoreductase (luciferase family)